MKDLDCKPVPMLVATFVLFAFMLLFSAIQILFGIHPLIAIGTSTYFWVGISMSFIVNFNRFYLVRLRNHKVVKDEQVDPTSIYLLVGKLHLLPLTAIILCIPAINKELNLNQGIWNVQEPPIAKILIIASGLVGFALNIWTTRWVYSSHIEPPPLDESIQK